MRTFKKLFALVLTLAVVANLFAVSVTAETANPQGKCGDNLEWSLDLGIGTLTISGTGGMYNYRDTDSLDLSMDTYKYPWHEYLDNITSIIVGEGIMRLENRYALSGGKKLETVILPQSLLSIGYNSFVSNKDIKIQINSKNLVNFGGGISANPSKGGLSSTSNLTLEIKKTVESVNLADLSNFNTKFKIEVDKDSTYLKFEDGVLYSKDGKTLVFCPITTAKDIFTVPSTVEKIGYMAFINCEKIKTYVIPNSVIDIGGFALGYSANIHQQGLDEIPYSNITIVGSPNSAAQKYANDSNFTFKTFDEYYPNGGTQTPVELTPVLDSKAAVDETNNEVTFAIDKLAPDKLFAEFSNQNITVLDKDGNPIENTGYVGTGSTITVEGESESKTYTVIIMGDVFGTGNVTAASARKALRTSAQLDELTGVFYKAADVINDGKVTAADARRILRVSAQLETF